MSNKENVGQSFRNDSFVSVSTCVIVCRVGLLYIVLRMFSNDPFIVLFLVTGNTKMYEVIRKLLLRKPSVLITIHSQQGLHGCGQDSVLLKTLSCSHAPCADLGGGVCGRGSGQEGGAA